MEATDIKSVYFIGAGGIGMSAIARYFLHKGIFVAGYDKTPSALTSKLEEEGMAIHFADDPSLIPDECRDAKSTLVVYTPAIPADHREMAYFRQGGFEIQKRAQVLGTLTRTHKGLCVAGTHGKTTTSSMCAHIMHESSSDCNAFLGGITKNYGTNYILSDSDYVVIEADEYDRSFHWLRPWITVITATDPDHLDIYGTKEAYLESFRHYTTLIQPGGALIIHRGLEMQPQVGEGVRTFDYRPINIENAVAAMAMAQLSGCTDSELRDGMATYSGVDRRFDFKVKDDRHVVLSDYAHHPMEIYQSAKSIRELYQNRKVTAMFQPHLYTRTRDFYKDFANSLSLLDEVVLCDIYPAREEPIPGVTSQLIYDNLRPGIERAMIRKDDVLDYVRSRDFDVLLVLGAGDLDNYVESPTAPVRSARR